MTRKVPEAPAYDSLPVAIQRDAGSSSALQEMELSIEVVTPILGGATKLRYVDEVDIIRVAALRGQLRFWWRALNAQRFKSPRDLYTEECELWGGAAVENGPGRSTVDIRVFVEKTGGITQGAILPGDFGSYALWPAGRPVGELPAKRRLPETRFRLLLRVPEGKTAEVSNAVRTWLIFGGYGSRTRRGLGSFSLVSDRKIWLPEAVSHEAFEQLFGCDIFKFTSETDHISQTPILAGASLLVGKVHPNSAEQAWHEALGWLQEFRQGVKTGARKPGGPRPSVSNWPEADKVRHLLGPEKKGLPLAHKPRHNSTPAWPRAGFGLPIVGQFQRKNSKEVFWDQLPKGHPNFGSEPKSFEIRWRTEAENYSRLASPLIVKALPLASGGFVPCALWLNRSMPEGAEAGLYRKESKSLYGNTAAPFDRLMAKNDTPHFSALANKASLRDAFLDWLQKQADVTVVAR